MGSYCRNLLITNIQHNSQLWRQKVFLTFYYQAAAGKEDLHLVWTPVGNPLWFIRIPTLSWLSLPSATLVLLGEDYSENVTLELPRGNVRPDILHDSSSPDAISSCIDIFASYRVSVEVFKYEMEAKTKLNCNYGVTFILNFSKNPRN